MSPIPRTLARIDRIRELKLLGWTNRRIGSELGISAERVRQLLLRDGSELSDRELAERERHLALRILNYDSVRVRLAARLRLSPAASGIDP